MKQFQCWCGILALASATAAATAQAQAQLVPGFPTNSTWRYFKGRSEAAQPDRTAWRSVGFGDAAWATGAAPFFYGEPLAGGTVLGDMQGNYSTLFLRRAFVVTNVAEVAKLELEAACDDGFIAWLNGVEVARERGPESEPLYISVASANAPEPVGFGAYTVPQPGQVLVNGLNVLAVQVFNVSLGSSDLVFDAALTATLDPRFEPVVVQVEPAPGPVESLTRITVQFSVPVGGVEAADLWVNGLPCTGLTGSGTSYTFTFAQPAHGTVQVSWDPQAAIASFSTPPVAFNPTGPNARFLYELAHPTVPTVARVNPPPGSKVRQLRQVEVLFDQPVSGVEASDLRVNGQPAAGVSGVAAGPYVFQFPAVTGATATLTWAIGHGIVDLATETRPFAGGGWSYAVDPALFVPDVVINEFLAQNVSTIRDEDLDFEDWIELYNRGDRVVNLAGWSLTDDPRQPGQWVFPSVTLAPRQSLVVFASGKDRAPSAPGARLHTNFKLSLWGEYLGLFNAESPRQAVSELAPAFPEQRNNHSYGRDSLGQWRYFARPTPGAANGLSPLTGVLAPVHFSVRRGYFNYPFNLSLATETPGAAIRYTLDGSEPTESNGLLYDAPIPIGATRILRAAAFRTNALPSRVTTHTYLFRLPPSQRLIPALSIVTASNHLYGRTGIMEYNPRNTTQHGLAWERPVSAEYIRPEDNGGFQVDCGLRVHGGGYIRGRYNYRDPNPPNGKYSFRLYFRGDYGEGRLRYPLIPGIPVQTFDKLVLRAGMNDPTNPFITDEVVRRWAADTGQVAARGTFVHLFLNGVYEGYYNPTERIDSDFLQTWHGGGEAWDVVASGSELKEGDLAAWTQLKSYANANNLALPDRYLEIERRLDTTNFVDYLLPLIYVDADDWPHNNWRAARERVPEGRYRMYVWDAEWAFGLMNGHAVSFNTIAGQLSSLSPPWGSTEIQQLFRRITNSFEFRLLFADRVHRHLFNDGALTDQRLRDRYESVQSVMRATISGFNDRIGTYWIPNRRRFVTNHLAQAGLIASSNAPSFSPFGGRVARGHLLSLEAGWGTVYYTIDGPDPRERFSGAVAPGALAYTPGRPIVLDRSVRIRARTRWDTNWSALSEAAFQVEEFGSPLRISEIMYHPPGGEAYEFIELLNTSLLPVDLNGITFEGVQFRFLEGARLEGRARLVLASDQAPAAFAQRYPGLAVAGYFGGSLSNGGERLALIDPEGRTIVSVDYRDDQGWPPEADGAGFSLEIVDALGDPDDPANWRASARPGGSPGAANPSVPASAVRLNELMAENLGAVRNGATAPDWVELYHAGSAPLDLEGWSLTDGRRANAFQFPAGATLPAGGYLVVWCDAPTSPAPGLHTGFGLKREGDTVWLLDPQGQPVDAVTFGPQAGNFTLARLGTEGAWQLGEPTPGSPNEPAQLAHPSQIAINEFVANAVPGGTDWIELFNRDLARPAALRGLALGTGNALHPFRLPAFIAPGGYVVFRADEQPGPDRVDFKLPAAAGTILLWDSMGAVLDRLAYAKSLEGVSQGRLPDGTSSLIAFPNSASPGAANYLTTYAGPLLNEVLARSTAGLTNVHGEAVDWIELVNPTDATLDLAGMSLSVDRRQPGRWVFPPNTTLPPSRFLLVHGDGSRPPSTQAEQPLNLGDSLDASGGGVYLFNPAGQLVDLIEYGFQLPDRSLGRSGDGWALLVRPTPGEANEGPVALGNPVDVCLNEWLASGDESDWLELYNRGHLPVDLGGLVLTDDPSIAGQTNHVIRPHTFIPGYGWVQWIADGNPARGPEHLPFRLDALGETLRLYRYGQVLLESVDLLVQQQGVAQGRFPDGSSDFFRFPDSPSPGSANFLPHPDVVINEVLSHTDPPLEDAVELFNLSSRPVPIGGWWLSDDRRQPSKYRIPDGTVLPPNAYLVVYQYQFGPSPDGSTSFWLDPDRDGEVLLAEVDAAGRFTGFRAQAQFGPSENGVSFGRHVTSAGTDFVALNRRTFGVDDPRTLAEFRTGRGGPNAMPQVGPVVINEIMFQPAALGLEGGAEASSLEYIELFNPTDRPVPLWDERGATNSWRLTEGVAFDFGQRTLPPHGLLVVVGFDPTAPASAPALAAFLARYGLDDSARALLVGPYRGQLANTGEAVALARPEETQWLPNGTSRTPYLLVERVRYAPHLPWPTDAAGTGLSLQRSSAFAYGNEPLHWRAGRPSPARLNSTSATDTDGDGLPDEWEILHGLNPDVAAGADGALGDPDRDGLTNRDEYLRGTDPRFPSVVILGLTLSGNSVRLGFNGIAGYAYSIEFRDSLTEGAWELLTNLTPVWVTEPKEVSLFLPSGVRARYFRMSLLGGGG